jgi:hypothetical protein
VSTQQTNKGEIKMSIDDLRKRLKGMNYAWLGRQTGLSRFQIAGVANGTTKKPDHNVVKTLIEYFEGE